MIQSLAKRFQVLKSNLNVSQIVHLVWSISPKRMITTISLIVIETCLFFLSLYAIKLLIDAVSEHAQGLIERADMINAMALAGLSGIAYVAFKSLSSYTAEVQSATIAEHISNKIHEKTIALDLQFYESPDYFDVLNRALNAGTDRPTIVIETLFDIMKNGMSLIAIGTVLITIDWLLLPILALFVIPTFLVRINFADKYNNWRIRQTPLERQSEYYSTLITTERHAKEIRSYNLGKYFKDAYMKIRVALLGEKIKISREGTKFEILTATIASFGFFSCIGYIILGPKIQTASIGDITLFLVIFPQSFNVLQAISSGVSSLYYHNIFIKSIFELLELKTTLKEPSEPKEIATNQSVRFTFDNVSFAYPNSAKTVLKNISFEVKSRQIIAIAGVNGAGKTTLIKLLCRFYDVSEGQILLDGSNIKNYKTQDYRKQVGMVFQDFAQYQVSAADNIRFGNIDKNLDMDEVKVAAVKSGASTFIDKFPDRYDNMMGKLFENGEEVSIGQWQKLANARCLYSDARLLIFDEATSALDAQAEKEFFHDFRKHIGNRAAIIISHRHSAIKNADHIYVLSEGKIAQSGTDEQLLQQEGVYADLFKDSLTPETITF